METFHGYDFETMTEIPVSAEARPAATVVDRREIDGDLSFMRGLMYGLLFTIPCWIVLAGAMVAVLQ